MDAIRGPALFSQPSPAQRLAEPEGSKPEVGFGQLVHDVLAETVTALRTAETTSTAALEGKASIQQVVDAVMHAERQLQTTLAVRDKVVAAYLDISRMQI